MQHLSRTLTPRTEGLTPFVVQFERPASADIPSLRAEGLRYQHPERTQTVCVWATDAGAIATVLDYHYPGDWHSVQIVES